MKGNSPAQDNTEALNHNTNMLSPNLGCKGFPSSAKV